MGAEFSQDNRSDVKSENIRLKELNPAALAKIKNMFEKNPLNTQPDKKQLMSMLSIGKRETDIIFEYFDMDGNGLIDSYEFICAIAMLVHSSVDLKAEFLFKLYDFDGNNYLSREEVVYLMRTLACASKRAVVNNDIERRVDELMKHADIDLDKRISLKEFQSYASKNREIFLIFDNYSILLSNNPMSAAMNSTSKSKKREVNESDDEENRDNQNNQQGHFNEDENFGAGDEMDPDLYNELNKDRLAEERREEDQMIKQGVEFKQSNGIFQEEEELQGDQFGALKPWITNLVHTVPSDYKPSSLDGAQPDAHLDLEFVHGYRCHDTRNNLRYTADGKIAYHTAAVGIIYDKETHTQQFYLDHMDDITALAIHPSKNYVATGEIGPYPLISVWDTSTMKPVCKMTGPLTKGINHLAFSKDGKYLVASAADDNHGVAIFEWAKGTAADTSNVKGKAKATATSNPVVASGDGGRANILSLCFNNSNDTVALTCVKEVNFVSFTGGKFVKKKATGLKGDNLTSIMCGVFLNNTLVCGSFTGSLLTFTGASFSKSLKAHSSCVNCIYLRENNTGFISGGNDGMVLVWDSKFTITTKLNINNPKIASLCPKVRSVCEDSNDGTVLVGTRGGDILEFEGQNPEVLLRGHFDLELWGLAVHPKKNKYYTVGQDKMLALWDVETRKIEKFTSIVESAEFMHVSPDGKDLAIGTKTGNLYIYDAISFEKKASKNERKGQPIAAVKYSPDGQYLAVGGVDGMIFVYEPAQNYKRVKKLIGHTSRVTHIDWSADNELIQSNSTSYELLYHNISNGTQITKISSLRDTDWNSWTCVLGWPVQGIWPPCASGDDINAVDRDKNKKIIVTADDFGKVKLFKYPSPVDKASFKPYVGHSSHVTCVRFTSNSSYVLSTGGNDKSIFQWKFTYEHEAEQEALDLENINEKDHIPEDEQCEYFKQEEMEGTEFGANKPWIGELKASIPKSFVPAKNAHLAPVENIKKLRYVFGYRAFDTRMNIKYTNDPNKIVYHAAALGIVLDKNTNTQTFFTHHEEDIVALAIHPNKKIIATGQMAKAGKAKMIDMYVWDMTKLPNETNCEKSASNMLGKDVRNLKGCHLRAIRILQFSPDGTKLLSGGQDDDNSVAVHDWDKSQLIVKSPVDKARVLDAVWLNNDEFVTVGPKHIKFFELKGRTINAKKGVFGKMEVEPLISVAVAFENKSIVTGTSSGNLIVWMGKSATTKKELYKGPIYSLYAKDNLLYVGGFDGSVFVFTNSKLNEKKEAKLDLAQMTRCDPGIRSIDINDKGHILIGTKGGDIIEVMGNTTSNKTSKTLMKSHAEEELWGLTINPTNAYQVASGGGDKSLRVWDLKTNKQSKFWMCDQDFRAIDWSSDGKFIVVGSMLGRIYYIQVDGDKCTPKGESYQSIFKGEKQWIQELKISPNGKFVAYGSHCGVGNTFSKIEILNVTNNAKCPFTQYACIDPKITSALTHLDWDKDSDAIVCNSLAFELKFMCVSARKRIDASASRDIEWNTWTCLFGFPVQGIWPPEATGYVVNYTCMSNNKKIVATGDDFGLVKLFRCPSVVEQSAYKAYKGHSSHVPKIRFTKDDTFLVSVGGNDKCVFIWETDFGKPSLETGNNHEDEEEDEDHQDEDEGNDDEENNEDQENDEENNEDQEEENGEEENDEDADQEQEEEIVEEEEEPEPEPEPPKKGKGNASSTGSNQTKTQINNKNNSNNQTSKNSSSAKQETPQKPSGGSFLKGIVDSKAKQQAPEAKSNPKNSVASSSKTTKGDVPSKTSNASNASNTSNKQSAKPQSQQQSTNNKENRASASKKMAFQEEEDFQGDEAGAEELGDPWRHAIEAPDNEQEIINKMAELSQAPKAKLKLDHVFGYRTKDTKNNLVYLTEEIVAYHAGKLGIVHNLKTNKQSFYTGHNEEIISFAVSQSRSQLATGEGAVSINSNGKSNICIWDNECKEICKFENVNDKGINSMAFSPSGNRLIAVGLDDDHTLYLFDVPGKKLLSPITGDISSKILDVCFKSESEFVTVGIKHYKYWNIKDKEMFAKEGILNLSAENKVDSKIGCVKCLPSGIIVTGSATGEISIWKDERVVTMKKVHSKNIDTIFVNEEFILTGGRDYCIVVSDKELSELRRISLEPPKIDSVISVPRSLELPKQGISKILLGTLGSEIFELNFESGNILYGEYKAKCHLSSHYSISRAESNDIQGLVFIPKKDVFASVSEDMTLRFWDPLENKQIEYFKLDVDNDGKKIKSDNPGINKASCLDVNSKETHLIIGFLDGSIRSYAIDDDFKIHKIIEGLSHSAVTGVKYAPNGSLISVSFKDGSIKLLSSSSFETQATLKGHSTEVLQMDWSEDSNYLASTSLNGELLYFNVKKGTKMLRTSDLKNEEWHTLSRPYDWRVKGLWEGLEGDGASFVLDRSRRVVKDSKVIAVGDKKGQVRVFKYPLIEQQLCLSSSGHCMKISNLKMRGNSDMFMTTGADGSIMKWTLQ